MPRWETFTTPPAGALVTFAGVSRGQHVLDVACGTGVVAITAARRGAVIKALDLSPVLIEHALQNVAIAGVTGEFIEGDIEALPYADASFDVVLSQFGHMFCPRPALAISEMLRVLKPGGRIAFSTWPPEMFTGRMFGLVSQYLPPPAGVPAATDWGDARIARERLGDAVTDIVFERGVMSPSALSPAHFRTTFERTAAPVLKLVQTLQHDQPKLAQFRAEFDALIDLYYKDNMVSQHYLMTRAVKR